MALTVVWSLQGMGRVEQIPTAGEAPMEWGTTSLACDEQDAAQRTHKKKDSKSHGLLPNLKASATLKAACLEARVVVEHVTCHASQ